MSTTMHSITGSHSKIPACILAHSSHSHPGLAYPPNHQTVALKIAAALLRHVEKKGSGRVLHAPCNVLLSRNIMVQPDILYVAQNRRGIIGKNLLYGAPDLVVEVISQARKISEYYFRKSLYSRFWVQELWTINLDLHAAETWIWSEAGFISTGIYRKSDQITSFVLPDLKLQIASIFRA